LLAGSGEQRDIKSKMYIQPSEMYGTYGIELTEEVLLNAGSSAENLIKGKAVLDDPTFKNMGIQGRFITMTEGYNFVTYSKFIHRHGDAAKQFMDDMDWLLACAKGAWKREQESNDTKRKPSGSRNETTPPAEHLETLSSK
tara:strand:+ start:182 stop:604 length:423 start_codon:yes stop_codon:yes gene_type:complete